MSNQYIYFSSKDQQPNDFELKFSDPVVIDPHSEVRCVSLRVNPKNNSILIDETNDTFAWSYGHVWSSDAVGDNESRFAAKYFDRNLSLPSNRS